MNFFMVCGSVSPMIVCRKFVIIQAGDTYKLLTSLSFDKLSGYQEKFTKFQGDINKVSTVRKFKFYCVKSSTW